MWRLEELVPRACCSLSSFSVCQTSGCVFHSLDHCHIRSPATDSNIFQTVVQGDMLHTCLVWHSMCPIWVIINIKTWLVQSDGRGYIYALTLNQQCIHCTIGLSHRDCSWGFIRSISQSVTWNEPARCCYNKVHKDQWENLTVWLYLMFSLGWSSLSSEQALHRSSSNKHELILFLYL